MVAFSRDFLVSVMVTVTDEHSMVSPSAGILTTSTLCGLSATLWTRTTGPAATPRTISSSLTSTILHPSDVGEVGDLATALSLAALGALVGVGGFLRTGILLGVNSRKLGLVKPSSSSTLSSRVSSVSDFRFWGPLGPRCKANRGQCASPRRFSALRRTSSFFLSGHVNVREAFGGLGKQLFAETTTTYRMMTLSVYLVLLKAHNTS
jgi:hypothetical protein